MGGQPLKQGQSTRDHTAKKHGLSLSQQPWIVSSSSIRGGSWWAPPSSMLECWLACSVSVAQAVSVAVTSWVQPSFHVRETWLNSSLPLMCATLFLQTVPDSLFLSLYYSYFLVIAFRWHILIAFRFLKKWPEMLRYMKLNLFIQNAVIKTYHTPLCSGGTYL